MDKVYLVSRGSEYSISSSVVEEVVLRERLSRITGMPSFVLGYFTHKGTIYSLIDINLGSPPGVASDTPSELPRYFIILRGTRHKIAIPAETVSRETTGKPAALDVEMISRYLDNTDNQGKDTT